MPPNGDPDAMPEELSRLGEFQRLYESSGRGVWSAILRGLVAMAVGSALVAAGEKWLVPRTWKYFLLVALAVAIFLNGLRVTVQGWRRRRQKVVVFEHGFALWRNDALSTFRWEQVEEIDVTPSFIGFAVFCRTDEGRRRKISFDVNSDPTQDLRGLWRELEERSSRHRLPDVLKVIGDGGEAVFVRKLW